MTPRTQRLILYTLIRLCTVPIVEAASHVASNPDHPEMLNRAVEALDYIQELIPRLDKAMGFDTPSKLFDVLRLLVQEFDSIEDETLTDKARRHYGWPKP
jgi:hypothetical protein